MTHTEWSYSVGLMVPAELVSTDPAAIEALVRRDLGGARNPSMYRTADPKALNSLNTMVVRRSGEPTTRWETVMSESPAKVREGEADFYDITQTWSEGTIEQSREIARNETRAWLIAWESSEFTHSSMVYDINAEQERRLSVTQGQARISGDTFTASWYAKAGTKVDFLSRTAWDGFYQSFHGHLEAGNSTFESAMSSIGSAADTAVLDAVLNGLPQIPGTASVRATGPLPGGQADQTKTEPVPRSA